MSSMCARMSGILAPFILILGDYWSALPFIIFGVNAIIAGILALLLPETLGTSLPQTLEEGEAFTSKFKKSIVKLTITNLIIAPMVQSNNLKLQNITLSSEYNEKDA